MPSMEGACAELGPGGSGRVVGRHGGSALLVDDGLDGHWRVCWPMSRWPGHDAKGRRLKSKDTNGMVRLGRDDASEELPCRSILMVESWGCCSGVKPCLRIRQGRPCGQASATW